GWAHGEPVTMQVYRSGPVADCPAPGGRAVTIGAFDGVHLGHQALLRLVRHEAATRGLQTGLVTFDRHPAQVVRPASAPALLTTLDQKVELLAATGFVDHCLVITFDEARAGESAEEFVADVLVDCLGAQLVVVGADFHFGNRRRGDVELLRRLGAGAGFEVVGVELVGDSDGGAVYSSTVIRQLLAEGRVEEANRLLGRSHEVRGRVAEGDRRGGSQLGFPTANVMLDPDVCLPAIGIYAGTLVSSDGTERPAAVSLGRRPTFYDESGPLLLEAYVLEFSGDLYGQEVAVRFAAYIRPEERFDSAEALVAAMHRDVDAVRRSLDALAGGGS
ncbi:MAG: bifunctional riboflavin kinase/FAD synthetase, partial [Acidimicrobiia bacterium]